MHKMSGDVSEEMNSRREFYSKGLTSRKRGHTQEEHVMKIQSDTMGEESQQSFIRAPSLGPADSESLSISLEYLPRYWSFPLESPPSSSLLLYFFSSFFFISLSLVLSLTFFLERKYTEEHLCLAYAEGGTI